MKIQYASDLHLEFSDNRKFVNDNPLEPVGDILVLAGDTCYLAKEHFEFGFFDYVSKNWKQVYLIPGNHEFYMKVSDVSNVIPTLNHKVRENVTYLNNQSVEVGNTKILFTTLWTEIKNIGMIEQGMNDFRQCTFDGDRFRARDHNYCNQISLQFLDRELSDSDDFEHVVVVSHHVPFSGSYCNYPFISELSEGFHIDLSSMMKRFKIDYWVYGHNHHHLSPFQIENTALVTNQLGYVMREEHGAFRRDAVIDLR